MAPSTIDLPDWYEAAISSPRLDGVHPTLRTRVEWIVQAMAILGFRMFVAAGVRTDAEQAALYTHGRTAPGIIVTRANGTTSRSNHQRHPAGPFAGYASAVDMAFIGPDGKATWSAAMPWMLYGRMATALGLVWGGDWKSFKDQPHIELKG